MLHLLLVAQLAVGAYTYTAAKDGQTVGTSQVTVKANGTGTEIDETSSGVLNGETSSGTATYVLGADLSPVTYSASGKIGSDAVKDSASVNGTTASISSAMGATQSFNLTPPAKQFIVVDLGAVAGFVPLAAQMSAWNKPSVTVLVPMYGLALAIEPKDAAAVTRPATVPATDVALTFASQAPFTMWYDPTTLIPDEIDVPSQGITVTRKHS